MQKCFFSSCVQIAVDLLSVKMNPDPGSALEFVPFQFPRRVTRTENRTRMRVVQAKWRLLMH